MPTGKPKPATPREIQMFGHIKVALAKLGWSPHEVNTRVGLPPGNSQAYKWLSGKGAPGPKYRGKLAKAAGLTEAALMPRKPGAPPPAQALVIAPPGGGKLLSLVGRTTDPLVFRVTATGEAQIKLDVTLPLATATPLLRMLLDAGIVFGPVEAG